MAAQSDIRINRLALVGEENADHVMSLIRSIPGFPKEGIIFRDFMPVLADAKGLSILMDALEAALPVPVDQFDAVAGRAPGQGVHRGAQSRQAAAGNRA